MGRNQGMEFGLLGPLVVCHHGVALPVTRGKQRTNGLAALLLDAKPGGPRR